MPHSQVLLSSNIHCLEPNEWSNRRSPALLHWHQPHSKGESWKREFGLPIGVMYQCTQHKGFSDDAADWGTIRLPGSEQTGLMLQGHRVHLLIVTDQVIQSKQKCSIAELLWPHICWTMHTFIRLKTMFCFQFGYDHINISYRNALLKNTSNPSS